MEEAEAAVGRRVAPSGFWYEPDRMGWLYQSNREAKQPIRTGREPWIPPCDRAFVNEMLRGTDGG